MLSMAFFADQIRRAQRLGKWFIWRRRRLTDELTTNLGNAALAAHQLTLELGSQREALIEWEERYTAIAKHKDVVEAQLSLVSAEVEETTQALTAVRGTLNRLEESYAELHERNHLVVDLLSVRAPANPGLSRLRELIEQDYMAFANEEQSLAEEAEALLLLQGVLEDLRLLSGFPAIYGKRRVAIAGSFSAGKSELVNSFIREPSVRLAVGVEPVTAIPTFVVTAPEVTIRAYGANGGSLRLSADLYTRISHDFIKSLGFDLKRLLPALSLGVPLDDDLFGNICLIDTPGYNPSAGGGYTEHDGGTAREFIEPAAALLWVVGIDANGTLSASDLRFIRELELGNRPLYVIINKADLRSASEIKEILDEVADVLADEEIPVAGISAYSAKRRKEYAFHGMSLTDFVRAQNKPSHAEASILGAINDVFDMYDRALKAELQRFDDIATTFKSMHLDVMQYGSDQLYEKLSERFAKMRGQFNRAQLDEFVQQAELLRAKLLQAARDALDDIPVLDKHVETTADVAG